MLTSPSQETPTVQYSMYTVRSSETFAGSCGQNNGVNYGANVGQILRIAALGIMHNGPHGAVPAVMETFHLVTDLKWHFKSVTNQGLG